MKKFLCAFALAGGVLTIPASAYQNFAVAVYIPVSVVNTFSDPAVLKSQWETISAQVRVDKVYIEVQRGRVLASDELLESVKAFFKERGVQVAGGSAFSDASPGLFKSFCYTDPADRDFVRKTSELAARHFDEFILDDFFFVNTKEDSDIAAKGKRSWTEFRLGLMDEAAQSLVVGPSKKVNPKIKVVIKFPNWYEHFQGLGFDLAREPSIFDGIYTGTETRDPTYTDQFLQPYESFQIIRYFDNIKPGGNGGGWVDTYGVRYVDRYAEQLWDTVLAKAPEMTLFEWVDLVRAAVPGDRKAWENQATSLNFASLDKDVHPDEAGAPMAPSWAAVAGASLRQIDGILGKLGNPIGIASYKPYQSTGEDFLHNYIGMMGIPIDLRPEFPSDANLVLLTESAKGDPQIVAKIKKHLESGKTVVITTGLLRALQDRGIQEICETSVSESKVLAHNYASGFRLFERENLEDDSGKPGILFPEVRYLTNDAWDLVSALENGNGYPILLMDRYSKGTLYVWAIPDNFSNLYALPTSVTRAIKNVVMGDFFVRIDGPSHVALFAYDNNAFVIESFLPTSVQTEVTLEGNYARLRNLTTGEAIDAYVPEVPREFQRWHLDTGQKDTRSHFHVTLPPHSYAAFAAEK